LRYKFKHEFKRWPAGSVIDEYIYRRLPINAKALCDPLVDPDTVDKIVSDLVELLRKNNKKNNMVTPAIAITPLTQPEMLEKAEVLRSETRHYAKFGTFAAREVTAEEKVDTVINGVLETSNTAKPGDYVLTGAGGEQYVLTPKKLAANYVPTPDQPGHYDAVGEVDAVQVTPTVRTLLGVMSPFRFIAAWGETMLCEDGDYLAFKPGEVYRIQRNMFEATYRPV
jgi:hypothetical protein